MNSTSFHDCFFGFGSIFSSTHDSTCMVALAGVFDYAEVAKLVDALDLGSSVLRRESSSLSFRTKFLHGLSPRSGAF